MKTKNLLPNDLEIIEKFKGHECDKRKIYR